MPVRLPKKLLSAVFAKVSRMDLTVVYPVPVLGQLLSATLRTAQTMC